LPLAIDCSQDNFALGVCPTEERILGHPCRITQLLLTDIIKRQQEVKIELKPMCAPQFMRIAKEMGMNLRFARGCLVGNHYCIISPKGEVQPCAYLNISLGNVRETPFNEIWANSSVFQELRTLNYKGGCGVCKYKFACGGCRARAAFYGNDDYMEEESRCLYNMRKAH